MPKTFKKEFRTDGCTTHIRKKLTGKQSFTYEIRYRRNGYNISVCSTDLQKAKNKFIEKLKTADLYQNTKTPQIPKTFNAFAMYYFETFRKRKVAEETYSKDLYRYKRYLLPYFNETPIKKITPMQCQALLESILKKTI